MPNPGRLPTVFFLSDYGTEDEFVGVVHAVLLAAAPQVRIVDLTHQCPAFDVRAGAHALTRAVPHLGPGVVLAVVDPRVGGDRRAVCLALGPGDRPSYFVGPDNGLLIAAAELAAEAPVGAAYELIGTDEVTAIGHTFDGRDLFAPAAAALCNGTPPEELGRSINPGSLVRLPGGVVDHGRTQAGRTSLRAEVTWVDHFGNVQLAATLADARQAGWRFDGTTMVEVTTDGDIRRALRCVEAFAELAQSELGLLPDANGHVAIVAGEASAARWLNVVPGDLIVLEW
jgi:S-adenosylmethionine hydrolase